MDLQVDGSPEGRGGSGTKGTEWDGVVKGGTLATPGERRGLQHIKIAGILVRHHRSFLIGFWALLLVVAAGAALARRCSRWGRRRGLERLCLTADAAVHLTARVTGISPATVTFEFSPASCRRDWTPVGPNATGLTTITYTGARIRVPARQTITVTATAADGARVDHITLVPPTVTVQVTPATVSLKRGDAALHRNGLGVSQTGVTWSISPQAGAIDRQWELHRAPAITAAADDHRHRHQHRSTRLSGTANVQLNCHTSWRGRRSADGRYHRGVPGGLESERLQCAGRDAAAGEREERSGAPDTSRSLRMRRTAFKGCA